MGSLGAGIISQGEAHEALARTEIRCEPAHFVLKFFEQPRNQATKPDNFVPSLLCCSTTPHSALPIPHLTEIRLGGARAFRVRVRASRPNHRWTNELVEGFSARRRKRQPGRSRSPFPNSALERLFSGLRFGMDDSGNWCLNFLSRERREGGEVRRTGIFVETPA
jgi:hypothetical protein